VAVENRLGKAKYILIFIYNSRTTLRIALRSSSPQQGRVRDPPAHKLSLTYRPLDPLATSRDHTTTRKDHFQVPKHQEATGRKVPSSALKTTRLRVSVSGHEIQSMNAQEGCEKGLCILSFGGLRLMASASTALTRLTQFGRRRWSWLDIPTPYYQSVAQTDRI